jgi:hypothetical protein
MVVLWRHKKRSKEGAEAEHRRFPLLFFSLVRFLSDKFKT